MGSLVTEKLGSGGTPFLQKVDYLYNIRGWLKGINQDYNSTENDLFAMKLMYTECLAELNSGGEQYNGNISALKWINKQESNWKAYGFQYDKLNRLLNANYGEYNNSGSYLSAEANHFSENGITYDLNGNILTLNRRGYNQIGSTDYFGEIDRLSYLYNGQGNKITSVNDAISTSPGLGDFCQRAITTSEYGYDNNGNMIRDDNKGITEILYNYLNLPEKISFTADKAYYIKYTYDATGNKLKKTVYDNNAIRQTEFYNGGFVYKTTGTNALNPSSNLQYIAAEKGRIVPIGSSYRYEYMLKDHLGNSRVVFTDYDGNGTIANNSTEILQYADYYPFGMLHNRFSTTADDNRLLYNGKEFQSDIFFHDSDGNDRLFDWYDYGARMYDPQLGRWHTPDVLGEMRVHESPYCYVGNNPISRIDPDGRKWKDEKKDKKQADNDISRLIKVNVKLSNRMAKYDQKIQKAGNDGKTNKVERLQLEKADAGNRQIYNSLAIYSIEQMANDQNKTFRYGNSFTTQNQGTTTYQKATMARDADGTYVINNTGVYGNRVHESVHGGQIAAGIVDIKEGTDKISSLSVPIGWLETQAYRAEYAATGSIFFPVNDLLEITSTTIHAADPQTYPSPQ